MNLRKKLGTVAAGVALAVGGGLLAPQMASAAGAQATATNYGCPGSQIDTYPLYEPSSTTAVVGYAHLYYSSANGGTNCAVYVTSVYPGVYREMYVSLEANGPSYRQDTDLGNYVKYAGPVTLTHTDGWCVDIDMYDTPPVGGRIGTAYLGLHCH